MAIEFPRAEELLSFLKRTPNGSVDAMVLITGALMPENLSRIILYLDESVRVLKKGGLLFVQGRPDYLPELGVYLDRHLKFKYWIAIKSLLQRPTAGLPSVHAAVLLFVKGGERFSLKKVRFPHEYCAQPFLEAFPTWGKALKAAKLEIQEKNRGGSQDNLSRGLE